MSEFGLKAVIDATGAERGERELVKSFERIKKAAEDAARAVDKVSGTGRSVTQRGLAAAGGGSRARPGTTGTDRALAQESRNRIATERALQSALTRRENVELRIARQLGENAALTQQARDATAAYAQALRTYGAGSLQAVQAQGRFQRQMTQVSSAIAAQNGLLPVLERGHRGISNSIRDSARNLSVYLGPLNAVTGRLSSLAMVVGSVGPAMAGASIATAGFILSMRSAVSVSEDYERNQLRLEAVLRATGYASGQTAEGVREIAREVAYATLTSVQEVEKAAGVLMSFRRVSGDTFREVLALSQDLAATGFGSLENNARMLGRALEDPAQGLQNLRRLGVLFSRSQREVIQNLSETGRKAEAQRIILDRLQKQVGGAGAAEAGGLTGATDTLAQAWENFLLKLNKTTGASRIASGAIRGLTSTVEGATNVLDTVSSDYGDGGLSSPRNVYLDEIRTIEERLAKVNKLLESASSANRGALEAERDLLLEQLEAQRRKERLLKAEEAARRRQTRTVQAQLESEERLEKIIARREAAESEQEKLRRREAQLEARLSFSDPTSREADRAAREIELAEEHGEHAAKLVPHLRRIDDLEEQIERRREAAANSAAQREARRDLLASLDWEIEKRERLIELGGVETPEYRRSIRVEEVRREYGSDTAAAVEDRLRYQDDLDRQLRGMRGEDPTAGIRSDTLRAQGLDAEALAIDRASEAQRRYNELIREGVEADHARSLVDHWHEVTTAADQAAQNAALFEETWGTAADAAANALTQFATGSMSAMDALRSVVEQVAADMVRELFRVLIMQVLTGTIGSGFGGGGGTATGGPTMLFPQGGGGTGGNVFAGIYHRGGRVGLDPVPMRKTPLELFQHAPRYHSGGVAGLKPNEVPAILERGERVIPNGAGGGGDVVTIAPQISIRVEGGSRGPQADEEMAERIGRHVETAVNNAVDERLVKQRRPGGYLNPVFG